LNLLEVFALRRGHKFRHEWSKLCILSRISSSSPKIMSSDP
jgi:hypothetical protein